MQLNCEWDSDDQSSAFIRKIAFFDSFMHSFIFTIFGWQLVKTIMAILWWMHARYFHIKCIPIRATRLKSASTNCKQNHESTWFTGRVGMKKRKQEDGKIEICDDNDDNNNKSSMRITQMLNSFLGTNSTTITVDRTKWAISNMQNKI